MTAPTPSPPYYAVIFTSLRVASDGVRRAENVNDNDDATTTAGGHNDTVHKDDKDDKDENGGQDDYQRTAELMESLAAAQPGYLGHESARNGADSSQAGWGITVSYWSSLEAIHQWKHQVDHFVAQEQGRRQWYQEYKTRICKVERDYGFVKGEEGGEL
jgi:heme-degrading monooxygenase HmoA